MSTIHLNGVVGGVHNTFDGIYLGGVHNTFDERDIVSSIWQTA